MQIIIYLEGGLVTHVLTKGSGKIVGAYSVDFDREEVRDTKITRIKNKRGDTYSAYLTKFKVERLRPDCATDMLVEKFKKERRKHV
jgi:hypothetical protein